MEDQFFLEGERVKWFMYYADMIVRNAGFGTVVKRVEFKWGFPDTVSFYDVLMDGGVMGRFEEYSLERYSEKS
tara:strand:+ start:249 stop:467 length:219 start_codon:yes stop_codon:yes gene_type:complete